jgi:hypothetical protein
MPSSARYLLDSDVLIAAKNLYYNPQYCEAFWSWVLDAHQANRVFSIDKVKKELLNKGRKDVLSEWAKKPGLSNFFLKSGPSVGQWSKLAAWAQSPVKSFKPAAQAKFLHVDSADAWLIAFAAHHGDYVIVTNEVPEPEAKKAIKLPDAAAELSVKTITLFEVLRNHCGKNFKFTE